MQEAHELGAPEDASPEKRTRFQLPAWEALKPSENAFARHEEESERHRRDGNAFYQSQLSRRGSSANKISPAKSTSSWRPRDSGEHPHGNLPLANALNDTSIAAGRDVSDISQNKSGNQSKPQVKNRPNPLDLESQKQKYVTVPTARAAIEAKSEKKLFKMMQDGRMTSPTETGSSKEEPFAIQRFDYSNTRANDPSNEQLKSPVKKRFLGMNVSVPSFLTKKSSESPFPSPSMVSTLNAPPKAARLLGSQPANTNSDLPSRFNSIRSNKSAISPPTAINAGDALYKPGTKSVGGESMALSSGTVKAQIRAQLRPQTVDQRSIRGQLDKDSIPPTPPAKDTPLRQRMQSTRSAHPDVASYQPRRLFKEEHPPTKTTEHAVSKSSEGWLGPQGTSNTKAHPNPNHRSEISDRNTRAEQPNDSLQGSLLPPAFYTPSLYSTANFSPTFRPSRNVSHPCCLC
jgi:hypothetical protein